MNQKNIVVTGGNSGIGLQTVRGLYKDGHNIIFGSRNEKKNQQAIQEIKTNVSSSSGKLNSYKLDLSQRKSIDEFANFVKQQMSYIDILINNAGLIMAQNKSNQLGIEMTMAINHLGPFYLTYLLMDNIKQSKEARIINVSSTIHSNAVKDITQNFKPSKFNSMQQYSDSKMGNVLFTNGLAVFLEKYPHIKTMSLHPGVVDSNFGAQSGLIKAFKCCCFCCFVGKQTGARTNLHLSRVQFSKLLNGQYYDDDTRHVQMDKRARNQDYVMKVWKKSEEILGINFKI